jgi:hypothetical protein
MADVTGTSRIVTFVLASTGLVVFMACGGGGGIPVAPAVPRGNIGQDRRVEQQAGDAKAHPRIAENAGDAGGNGEIEIAAIPWNEVNDIYNLKSKTTDIQKEAAWQRYRGERVLWSGEVSDIAETLGTLQLLVKMNPDTFASDLILRLRADQRAHAMEYKKGDRIWFIGTLSEWGTLMPISLSDAEIVDPGEIAQRLKRQDEERQREARLQRQQRLEAIEAAKTPEQKAAELAAQQAAEEEQQRRKAANEKVERERSAQSKLKLAKQFLERRQISVVKKRLQELIEDYPETDAASEAKELLKSI